MNTIRIETDGVMGQATRVFFTADDGTEAEISSVCTGAHVDIKVGEPNRATLDLIKVDGMLEAELVDVVVRHINLRRRRRRRRLLFVTTLGDRFVRVVRG